MIALPMARIGGIERGRGRGRWVLRGLAREWGREIEVACCRAECRSEVDRLCGAVDGESGWMLPMWWWLFVRRGEDGDGGDELSHDSSERFGGEVFGAFVFVVAMAFLEPSVASGSRSSAWLIAGPARAFMMAMHARHTVWSEREGEGVELRG